MFLKTLLASLVTLLMLTACIGTQVEVAPLNQFEPADYASFAWEEDAIENTGRNAAYYNLDHSLRRQVNKQLEKKGYRLVDSTKASFLVTYRYFKVISADQGGIISPRDESLSAWGDGSDINGTLIQNHYIPAAISHGHLEIDFDDAKSGKEIWKVNATKVVENDMDNLAAVKKVISHLVPRVLESFPKRP
jgi:hypothetical protein